MSQYRMRWILLLLAGVLGVAGYFGPWLPHRAAGLVITGLDLAEYVKFIPEVNSGAIAILREVFYLPLFAASVGAILLASRQSAPLPLRLLLATASVPLALAMLPPAWSPATLRLSEYRLQVLAILLCLLLLPALPRLKRIPDLAISIWLGTSAIAAAGLPAFAYLQLQPSLSRLYGSILPLGWGYWATVCGYAAVAILGLAGSRRDRSM